MWSPVQISFLSVLQPSQPHNHHMSLCKDATPYPPYVSMQRCHTLPIPGDKPLSAWPMGKSVCTYSEEQLVVRWALLMAKP